MKLGVSTLLQKQLGSTLLKTTTLVVVVTSRFPIGSNSKFALKVAVMETDELQCVSKISSIWSSYVLCLFLLFIQSFVSDIISFELQDVS